MTSPTTTNATTGMYVDYSIPLGLYDLIQQVISTTQNDPNTPLIPTPTAPQQWFSQPRPGNESTTEVIQVNFKLPLSVSEVGWEALRVSCHFEVWYQDRQNNWRQVLDDSRIPVTLDLSTAGAVSWYTAHFFCYPIVAKAIQFRITRVFDQQVGTLPYCVAMRNALLRRNIYDRSDGTQGIEPQQDVLGNVLTSYIKDWDASKSIDNNPATFWRSQANPDPNAVCSLYLDVRTPAGGPQLIDSLYLDPVYINQNLNIYYTNDDTTDTTKLSPVAAIPTTDENTQWQQGVGMWDISPPDDSQTSLYEFPMAWGPLINQNAWVGIEWTPDFSPVPTNAVQTVTISGGPNAGTFTLTYGGHTTIGLAWDSTALQVQNALIALSSIGTGNVLVGGPRGGPWTVTFVGTLGAQAITTMTVIGSFTGGTSPSISVATTTVGGINGAPPQNPVLFHVVPPGVEGINAVQTLTMQGAPTGGTFKLTYGGQTTASLAYNIDGPTLATALQGLSSVGVGNVLVSGNAGGPWTVTFVGTLADQPITNMVVNNTLLTGGSQPQVVVVTTQPGAIPVTATTGQYVPKIYYDVGGGRIVLELSDGTTVKTYNCPLSPIFTQYQTLRIVAAWGYNPQTVYLTVQAVNGTVLGTLTNTSPALPSQTSFDGSIQFKYFRGLFTAHVIKLEDWNLGALAFLTNPQIYTSPDPVRPDPSGNIPATTLDNAIFAGAWTMQEKGTGGSHVSNFATKVWTPIWSNYVAQKGKLFFPSQISCKYLQLEFSNLTEEPYPVYDSGIAVTYNVFPVGVTSNSIVKNPNLAKTAQNVMTMGADVLLTGVGSVNWLNPQSVNNAVNSIFGMTTTPASVTFGPGFNTSTLPNTNNLDLSAQTRLEVSSAWVYKRTPQNSMVLAAHSVNNTASSSPVQTMTTSANLTGELVANSSNPTLTTPLNPPTLPQQGSDWWVFPGGNMRLPANVMNGLTGSTQSVLTSAPLSNRLRFLTTSVHAYDTRTVIRDAAVAYFAGVREVQPMITTYLDGQDPATFSFSQYDPTQWVLTNVKALNSGPITTAGNIYSIINPEFDTDINNWVQAQGVWNWDATVGHWDLGTATVVANGTEKSLLSSQVDVAPGATIESSVWVTWSGLAATSGSEAIQLQAQFFNNGTFVSSQNAGLTYTPWPASTPLSGGNVWAQIVASVATSNAFTVPAGVNQMKLALVVTNAATAGQVWFDTVLIGTTDTTEATAFKDFKTTSSFTKVECTFTDSGLVRSDAMWAQTDPLDTNVSSTALAYYTSTIPDVVPAGMWGDTVATWGDSKISWGEPHAVVSIQVDPDRIYDGKRVLHFTRAGGAEEAGIKVRQVTNFIANGLARLGCVFYKPNPNTNQVTIRLRRVSDGVYIHQETFTPVVGYWFNYVTNFFEIPNSDDQEYTVELVCTGDQADDFYLNDLYTDVAGIRYFVRLGDTSQFLHDVTPLRYAGLAVVSTTVPVTEFSVQATILSPKAYCYTVQITPNYLK